MNKLERIFSDKKSKEAINKFFIFMTSDMGVISYNKGLSFFYSSGFSEKYDGLYAFKDNKIYRINSDNLQPVELQIPKNYKKIIQRNYEIMGEIE